MDLLEAVIARTGSHVDHVVIDASNLSGLDGAGQLLQLRPTEVLFEEWAKLRRAGKNLTLNLGVRYDLMKQPREKYGALAAEIRTAFNAKLYDAAKRQYATGSQCANSLALVTVERGTVSPYQR